MAWACRALGRHAFAKAAVPLGVAGCALKYQRAFARPATCSTDSKTAKSEESFWTAGESAGNKSLLAATYDLYGGVIIKASEIPKDPAAFREVLRTSMAEWKRSEKKGIWLQIGIESADLIPIATGDFGFEFHHAEKGHVMLTKWLPENIPNTLPMNASHTVGVGAVVTDDQNRILLVKEKSGPAARMNLWKLPTGLVDAGEELFDAAVREVKEETGVDAKFEFVGGFIVNHGGNLAHANKSNIFFTVKCKASSTAIQAQASEIAEARWFTLDEYHAMPFPEKDTVWDALNRSALYSDARYNAKQMPVGFRPGHRWFYYPEITAQA